MDMSLSKLQEMVMVNDREACHATVRGIKKIQTQLSDWIATTNDKSKILLSTLVYKVLAPEFAKFVVN